MSNDLFALTAASLDEERMGIAEDLPVELKPHLRSFVRGWRRIN